MLLPVIGQESRDKGLTRGALHLILKEVFGLAGPAPVRADPSGKRRPPCWSVPRPIGCGITAGSPMTHRRVDLRYVRDNFGHSSISTMRCSTLTARANSESAAASRRTRTLSHAYSSPRLCRSLAAFLSILAA